MRRGLVGGIILAAIALASTSVAQADPVPIDPWQADIPVLLYGRDTDVSVQMSAAGKGIFFSNGRYVEYNAVTGTWGAWKKLAKWTPYVLTSAGNARGDTCAMWGGAFGIAAACRGSNGSSWKKRNMTTSKGSYLNAITVSASGTHALVVWGESEKTAASPVTAWTRIFDFSTRTFATPVPLTLRAKQGTPYQLFAQPCGDGFMIAYVPGKRIGKHDYAQDSTFARVWHPGTRWGAEKEIRIVPPGGGTPRSVVMAALTSNGTTTAAAFTTNDLVHAPVPKADWWISTADVDGTFAAADGAGVETYFPSLAVSEGAVALAGFAPSSTPGGTDELELSVLQDGIVAHQRLPAPLVNGEPSRSGHMSLVGQVLPDGSPAFLLSSELFATMHSGTPRSIDVEQVATSVASVDDSGLHVSPLTRLGNTYAYDGMYPKLAGAGRYAMLAYSDQKYTFAALRQP